jgi:hypothetical protein
MLNYKTKSRHNLPKDMIERLERIANPAWHPASGFAPIGLAFIAYDREDEFYAIFYEFGVHHSVRKFNNTIFETPKEAA